MTVMAITYVTESPNTLIRSSRWNTNFTDITTFMNNNNIDATDNIKPASITTAALANLAVTDAKIAGITTAGKVSGAALTLLNNTPSGAGQLPGVNGGVPSGCILMWSGTIATIPSGFVLCNGSNGTPDLRNLFIVGADADSGGVAKSTVTGSALQTGGSTTISIGNMPAHTHNVTANSAGGSLLAVAGTGNNTTVSVATSSAGSGTPYTQPFYALAFIQKT